MNFKLVFIVFLTIYSLSATAGLQCSAKGTTVLFINGVLVKDPAAVERSADLIFNIINSKSIDESNESIGTAVDPVHNISLGLFSDLDELSNQAARNYSGEDRKLFFMKMMEDKVLNEKKLVTPDEYAVLKKKTDEALEFIHGDKFNSATPTEEEILAKKIGLKKITDAIREISFFAENVANSAAADRTVTDQVKRKIVTAITANKKVIFIAHSQGNEVLRTAVNELYANPLAFGTQVKYLRFRKIFGSLQLAVPSNSLATINRSEYVTLDKDLVIWGADMVTMPSKYPPLNPNYEYDSFYKSNFFAKILDFIPIFNTLSDNLRTDLFHGMDATYLNPDIRARKVGSENEQKMTDIFNENLIKVAEKLEDNCDPVITSDKIGCAHGFINTEYITTGSMSSVSFNVTGTGIIKSAPESQCTYNNSNDLFPLNENYIISCGGSGFEPSIYVKFVNEEKDVLYEKLIANPCAKNGPAAKDETVYYNF